MNKHILLFICLSLFVYYNANSWQLNICPYESEYLDYYYRHFKTKYAGDSGIDLVAPYNVEIPPYQQVSIDYQTTFVLFKSFDTTSYSYYLYPRSNLAKSSLVFKNGIGIIDAGFRGNLTSIIYNNSNQTQVIKKGRRLVQITTPDLLPMNIYINCHLSKYGNRGNKGFGSSGL